MSPEHSKTTRKFRNRETVLKPRERSQPPPVAYCQVRTDLAVVLCSIAPEHATTGTPPEGHVHSGTKSKPNSGPPNGEFARGGIPAFLADLSYARQLINFSRVSVNASFFSFFFLARKREFFLCVFFVFFLCFFGVFFVFFLCFCAFLGVFVFCFLRVSAKKFGFF